MHFTALLPRGRRKEGRKEGKLVSEMTGFYFFQRVSKEGYREEPIRSWGGAAAQQLPGSWAETAGIERKTGMRARSFALRHVPVPSGEQHPQNALRKDEVVPAVHAVLAAPSDPRQHAEPGKGRQGLLQALHDYTAMLIFPAMQARGWGPGAVGVPGSPAVTSREPLQRPLGNWGCVQRGEMNLGFQAAYKARCIRDLSRNPGARGRAREPCCAIPCPLRGWRLSGLHLPALISAKLPVGRGCPLSSPSRLHQQEASAYAGFFSSPPERCVLLRT